MLLLALVLSARPALAQRERDSTIQLTVAAPAGDAEALGGVARELLERLSMQVELRHVARLDLRELRQPQRNAPYFARVWVTLGNAGARLYLEHAARDRVLVRDVTDEANNPELLREELGHILQTAIEGLKAGEEIGAPRDEALKQVDAEEAAIATSAKPATVAEVTPKTAKQQEKPRYVRFGPRYEAIWLGDGARFEDGPGAVLGALLPSADRWGLELGGFFRRPLKVEGAPVGARLQNLGVNALVTFDAWRGERARLRLGAGAGADFVRVSPFTDPEQDVQLAESRWLKLALGRLTVTYAHALGSFMELECTLGVVLAPSRTRYVLKRTTSTTDVLAPSPVRPLISLGVTVP